MKNKYFENKEELLAALKEGKKIYQKDGTEEIYHSLENGVIVTRAEKDNQIFMINGGIGPSAYHVFYLKEPKPLTIEVGKFYKTRNYNKCICLCKEDSEYKIAILGTDICYWLREDGSSQHNAMQDIVDYWEE